MALAPGNVASIPSASSSQEDCRRPGVSECLLALAVSGVVFLSRVPVIRYPVEMNVDESQMLAQALRYTKDFVPWRGVDGTSSGPLNSWFLLLPHLLGMRLYYTEAHLLAAISWSASAFACWLAARFAFGAKGAMAGLAMMVAWLVCQQGPDFLQYSSEVLPVLLLSLALIGVASGGTGYYAAAVLLGLVPWSKLQAAPIGAVIGAWMLARILWSPGHRGYSRVMERVRTALLVFGLSLLPTIILIAFVARGGALEEMWRSYIIANLYYAGSFDVLGFLSGLLQREWTWRVGPWSLGLLIIWGVAFALRRNRLARFRWLGFESLAWMVFLVSWYVCSRPEQSFEHYQFLLLPGMALMTAGAFHALEEETTASSAASICCWSAVCAYLLFNLFPALSSMRHMMREPNPPASDAKIVLSRIEELAPGGQRIAIWGWFPSLYVESGIPPATRHAIAHFLYGKNPSRDYLRSTYMVDLLTEQPQVFVDAHIRLLDRSFARDPISRFPALHDYVRANFALVCSIDTSSGPVEIYLRKK